MLINNLTDSSMHLIGENVYSGRILGWGRFWCRLGRSEDGGGQDRRAEGDPVRVVWLLREVLDESDDCDGRL